MAVFFAYLLFAAIGYFLGSFAWSQIIGIIIATKRAELDLEGIDAPHHVVFMARLDATKMKYSNAALIWAVAIIASLCASFIFFPKHAWLLIAGLVISLISVFKNITNLEEEFLLMDSSRAEYGKKIIEMRRNGITPPRKEKYTAARKRKMVQDDLAKRAREFEEDPEWWRRKD